MKPGATCNADGSVAVAMAASAARADWPQFLGPNRDATSPEKGLLKAWPESGPKVLWSTAVGPGYAGPAIVGNEVFVLDRKVHYR